MSTTTNQIQELIPAAEALEPKVVAGAITDGSQAMAHDGYDVETFDRAVGEYARLARTIEESASAIHTGPALLRDLFWSFHKRAPRIAPIAPLSPAYEINQKILEQIFSTTEWREMRESGAVGDPLSSAMATIGCATSAIAALDKETVRYVNQLHELTDEVEHLFARAETLKELASLSHDAHQSDRLNAEAAQAQTDAKKKEKKAERLGRKLEESSEAREQQVRQAVRRGLAEALGEIEQATDAIKAFGALAVGYDAGFGTEGRTGGRNCFSTKEKLAIAERVGRSPKLQQIAAVCGRFTRLALGQQKNRVKHPPDEITSITFGDHIERLLPGEIALLSDPQLEDLFFLRLAERSLMQYDLIGHEPQGQGPIILSIDESGSMSEVCGPMTKEAWSKAVMLALLSIARLQKRDFAVIHFSGESDIKAEIFPKGQATAQEVLASADHFFNGGTVFDEWMDKSIELVGQSAFDKADSICISDGVGRLKPDSLANWQKMRADRGMRSYSILIGNGEGEQMLWQISDTVFCLNDLAEDMIALETIFSIGGS
jgi:uncharacterized protein with von Willebrand factor type A (vWA) domain